jgi:hypothetical protein
MSSGSEGFRTTITTDQAEGTALQIEVANAQEVVVDTIDLVVASGECVVDIDNTRALTWPQTGCRFTIVTELADGRTYRKRMRHPADIGPYTYTQQLPLGNTSLSDFDNVLTGPVHTFSVEYATPGMEYRLIFNNQPASAISIYPSTQITLSGLPVDGEFYTVVLEYRTSSGGSWQQVTGTVMAYLDETAPEPILITPADGSTLDSATLALRWSPRSGENYIVNVGSTEYGSDYAYEIYDSDGSLDIAVPEDGSTAYLSFRIEKGFDVTVMQLTYTLNGVETIALTPPSGTTLTEPSQLFTFPTKPGRVQGVRFGSSVDGSNLGNSGALVTDIGSYTVTDLTPVDGGTLHARITYNDSGTDFNLGGTEPNQFVYATYPVSLSAPAVLDRYTSVMQSPRYLSSWAAHGPAGGINWPDMSGGAPVNLRVVTNLTDGGAGSLKALAQMSNSWIIFDPSLQGATITTFNCWLASRVVIDGRGMGITIKNPGGLTASHNLFPLNNSHNAILGLTIDGNKNANSPNQSGFGIREGTNYFIDAVSARNFDDDSLSIGKPYSSNSADFVGVHGWNVDGSCNKGFLINCDEKPCHVAGRGGHVTLNRSIMDTYDRNPRNSGGSHVHVLNSACMGNGQRILACVNGGAGSGRPSSEVDARILAEHNEYRCSLAPGSTADWRFYGESANHMGATQSIGSQWIYTRGCKYSPNCIDDGSNSTLAQNSQKGNIVNLDVPPADVGDGAPTIPYSYALDSTATLWADRLADTGPANFIPFT